MGVEGGIHVQQQIPVEQQKYSLPFFLKFFVLICVFIYNIH